MISVILSVMLVNSLSDLKNATERDPEGLRVRGFVSLFLAICGLVAINGGFTFYPWKGW